MATLGVILALLGLGLAAVAFLAWRYARQQQAVLGLPAGRVVRVDMGSWQRCTRPLYSPQYRLAGKPDYLVRCGSRLIPVEVKPGRHAASPYASDVLQLGAYLLLVEAETGRRPPHGLLRYSGHTFEIPYTPALREAVIRTLREMQELWLARDVPPQHHDPWRCRRCGHRQHCNAQVSER
jgi:CRISPR-associated exonuclease Cas4